MTKTNPTQISNKLVEIKNEIEPKLCKIFRHDEAIIKATEKRVYEEVLKKIIVNGKVYDEWKKMNEYERKNFSPQMFVLKQWLEQKLENLK